MACCLSTIISRGIVTSSTCNGKRNFRNLPLYNKRGTRIFKKQQMTNPDPDIPIYHYGVRRVGYESKGHFVTVQEMIPELIVPDLTNFKLKPYVSYKAPDVVQSEFTAQDLFNVVYSKKIAEDFKQGKLDQDGNPLEPSSEESLTPQEAFVQARKTGSDLFAESKVKKDST
uniref:39S ribosomal protein L41, mitochondrial n=1 Tax=Timema genevievae TaxID=629358 RepID=A0A7R9PHE4_TIMGE|nr:unnamed protein product [Timema genevievae]